MEINWVLLIGFVVVCNLFGAIGALWTSGDSAWYKDLNKPSFNPPSFVFGPVWTLLFSLMGIALYLVWMSPSSGVRTIALVLFLAQFVLNVFWSYLFFEVHNLAWAFLEIMTLLVLILVTGVYFYFVNGFAGYLMLPYFVWVLFASVLNWAIWKLN